MIHIGFSTTNELISRLIRWFTRSDVSHTFIVFKDETLNEDLVLDVAWAGYRIVPWSTFQQENKILSMFVPPVDMTPGVRTVVRWLGRPYDWKAFARFSRWARIFVKHPVESQKALLCTEVVVHAMQISSFPGSNELDPKNTTPHQLYEFLQKTAVLAP